MTGLAGLGGVMGVGTGVVAGGAALGGGAAAGGAAAGRSVARGTTSGRTTSGELATGGPMVAGAVSGRSASGGSAAGRSTASGPAGGGARSGGAAAGGAAVGGSAAGGEWSSGAQPAQGSPDARRQPDAVTDPSASGSPGSGPHAPAGPVLAGITDEAASDLHGQLAVLAELGWSAIELRTVDGVAVADLSDEVFAGVVDALGAAGVRAVCLDSRIGNRARPVTGPFERDLAELEVLLRRCAELGTRYVRIMSYPNDGLAEPLWRARVVSRVRELAVRAEVAGVVLLHENCSGWAGASAERALELMSEVDSPALRLLFDTGNPVAHGYDGLAALAQLARHVEHVHVKDAVGERFVDPGTGDARVAECVELLRANGYQGAWSLEPHVAPRPRESAGPPVGASAAFVSAGRAMSRLLR
ncbi:sugar phosphate isomerase/epimerase family protein [Actinosynnema sp. NPDC000082]|uniref:sugar phosphate isomerase/epimerase family protein n=1 Tax=Actinosynnema sp. NPDC000082 TaxID=3363910 RepID=UPI003693ED0D